MISKLTLIVLLAGCSAVCVPDPVAGLYVDLASSASAPYGCVTEPYPTLNAAVTDVAGSGAVVILVAATPTAVYTLGGQSISAAVDVHGNSQVLEIGGALTIAATGVLTLRQLTLRLASSLASPPFTLAGSFDMVSVTVAGSSIAWGTMTGAMSFTSCTVQNTQATLMSASEFGVQLRIKDSEFSSNNGDKAAIVLLKPILPSPVATIFYFENSNFHGGSAPIIAILIDTSLFGDTYPGSPDNAITAKSCTWSGFTGAALSISTWFILTSFDHCTFTGNGIGILTNGQTSLMSVTYCEFTNNVQRALSFSVLGNPTVTTMRDLLFVDQGKFTNNGQGIAVDSGELMAVAKLRNTKFTSNGSAQVSGGCLYTSSVALDLQFVEFANCIGAVGPSICIGTTSSFLFTDVVVRDSTGADGTGAYINNGGGKMLRVLFDNLVSGANIIYTLSGVSTQYVDVTIKNCRAGKQIMNGYLNIWSIEHLSMVNSRAEDMLLYYTGTTETLSIYNSVFHNSSASSVHLHPGGTIVNFYNCLFNFTDQSETVILINTGELTSLVNCTLSGIFRTIFSGLLAEYQFNMQDCRVVDALIDGLFDGNYFTAYLTNTVFSNVTVRQASLVFLFKVNFYILNVTITNFSGNILNLSKSLVTIDNVTITNYTTFENYQFLEASETNLTITNFEITNFKGQTENSMFSFNENSIVNMTNCTFLNMFQTENVGLSSVFETNMTLINVTFKNWNVTLFDAQLSGFWFHNSSFTEGGSGSPESRMIEYDGGLVGGLHVTNVWMENCVIANIGARNGGVLYLYYDIPTKPTLQNVNIFNTFVVSINTTFENSTATQSGGMFFISEGSATLYNSTFVRSRAGEDGGFFNFLCTPHITDYLCKYNLTDIALNHSTAGRDGGAIKYNRMEPIMTNVLSTNNTAVYGPFIAGYAVRAGYIDPSRWDEPIEIDPINVTEASGEEIKTQVCLGLYDHRDVLVKTDSSSRMAVTSHSPTVLLSGLVNMQASSGRYKVEHITVISPPGSVKQLFFASDAIDYENIDPNTNILSKETPLTYILRNCTKGEILKGDQCYECEKGSYSFTTQDTLCQKCKQGMICNHGANVTIEAGYWRPGNESDDVFACTLADKCLGGVGTECVEGYTGRLCTVCVSGWFRYGRALCSKCGNKTVSITEGCLIMAGVALFLAFIIYSSLSAVGKKKKSDISVQLRILINFVQVMMLMNNFQIIWPNVLTRYFDGLYVSGNSSQMAFSAECYSDEGEIKYMFQKLILMTVMPVAITVLSCFCWGIVSLLKKKWMYVTQHNICTMCVLMLTVHPMILQSAGQLLTCKDMEKGTSWLVADMTIQCWVGRHLMFTTMMAVPVLIFWCIGIPLAYYISLVYNRRRLKEEAVARRFAFIYSGYQPESYYWEFVVVVRKSYFVLVSNLLSTYNVDVQSYTGLLGLAFFLLIHNIKKPFAGVKLNQLEAYSLIASIITLICGMMYDTTLGSNYVTYYIMVAVVLAANLNFLLRCLSGVLKHIREFLATKYPRLRGCLYPNRKNMYSVTQNADLPDSRFSYPEIKDNSHS